MSSGGFPRSKVLRKWLAAVLIGPLLPCAATAGVLSLAPLPDIMTAEDTPSQPVPVRVTGTETRPVSFAAASSNHHLVPEANVQFRESGPETVVVVTPAANEAGKSLVSI